MELAIIVKNLNERDLPNMRLVCKRWHLNLPLTVIKSKTYHRLNDLTEVVEWIGKEKIQKLDIAAGRIATNYFALIPGLRELTIHADLFKMMYLSFPFDNKLTKLNVIKRGFELYDKIQITRFTGLQSLYCNSNMNFSHMNKLTNLSSLHWETHYLADYSELTQLSRLTRLHMIDCDDKLLANLTNLQSLYCGCFGIFTDVSISRLVKLTDLEFDMKRVNFLTDVSLDQLTNLTRLVCVENENFTDTSFGKLTKLKHLSLYRSKSLTDNSLAKLTNLEYLCIYNYGFTNASLMLLTKLRELIIFQAPSANVVNGKFLPTLTNLRELTTSIAIENEDIANLTKLEKITFQGEFAKSNEVTAIMIRSGMTQTGCGLYEKL
jgi:hypothetical protein